MARRKFVTIQHVINPIMATHEVHFSHHGDECVIDGQVLFFSAHGGHWLSDDREHQFVGVYDPHHGALIALLNMAHVSKIVPPDVWA